MASIFDLIKAKRIHLTQSAFVEYDTATHLVKVMQYAIEHDCAESLLKAFKRLAPDADSNAVIIVSPEEPYNFFWYRITREEYDEAIKVGTMPSARHCYCGGLIGHAVYVDGELTMKRDWSIHT